jgi:hypothetical protein
MKMTARGINKSRKGKLETLMKLWVYWKTKYLVENIPKRRNIFLIGSSLVEKYTGWFTSNKEPNEICDAANITFAPIMWI